VNAVITTLGLQKPMLNGWSYGGVVICDYLRFYGEEQIGRVHFVGATSMLGEKLFPFLGKEFFPLQQGIISTDVEESIAATARFVRLCVYEEPTPEDYYFFLGFNVIVPPYVRTGLFSRNLNNDDLLPTLRKPVLITHGENDDIVGIGIAKYNAERIKHAKTSYYPKIGHAPFWEDAERFSRELRAFASVT
jgi:pimeloyl-ACP methyl ester carboxylesterase